MGVAATFDPDAGAAADSSIFGLPPEPPENARVVLLPVPFDATVSYGHGAAKGPEAILRASKQVELFDVELGLPFSEGIALLPPLAGATDWNHAAQVAATTSGGLDRANTICAALEAAVHSEVARWIAQGKLVGVIGGEHSVAEGSIRAQAQAHPGLGVLQVDAHADLRDAYQGFTRSHASVMFNVMRNVPKVHRLVQVGLRDVAQAEYRAIEASGDRIHGFFDERVAQSVLDGRPWSEVVAAIIERLPHDVYLSFDIDGLQPSLCPHTGTPVPGGLSFNQAVMLVQHVVKSGRQIVGFDLCEVAPGNDDWDGNVAARLLYKIIGWSLSTK